MVNTPLESELAKKNEIIEELRHELVETNKGIMTLVMELELDAEQKLQEVSTALQLLQKEIELTDQGWLALEEELELTKEKYRSILDNAQEAIFTFDENFLIESFNASALLLFGYQDEELTNMPISQLIPDFDRMYEWQIELKFKPAEFRKIPREYVSNRYGYHKSHHKFPVEISIGTPFYSNKKVCTLIVRDITIKVNAEQRVRLMAKVFEETHDAIIITDTDGKVFDVNDAVTSMTGYTRQEIVSKYTKFVQLENNNRDLADSMWDTLTKTGRWSGEVWDKKQNGLSFPLRISISSVKDDAGQVSHYVGIFTDITTQKEAEKRLVHLAHYDPLTGLPNRTLFVEKLNLSLKSADKNKRPIALFFLDLDRFKLINDTLGHLYGDQVLIQVAQRIKTAIRRSDIAARLAGDEFTIILVDDSDENRIETTTKKLLDAFVSPFTLGTREVFITASIGISIYLPNTGQNAQSLINHADIAMYQAKEQGKNTFAIYDESMTETVNDKVQLENDLRQAIFANGLELYYQPQIDIKNQQIIGVEALVRWNRPGFGFVPPTHFIPIAEQSDLIIHLGNWVLKRACRQFTEWCKEGLSPLKISVNYSGIQLKQKNLLATISDILEETQMDPKYLCLELTESIAMENAESIIQTLGAIKNKGVSISIDDFGTGYSSLSYLKRFPIDILKIDRSFVMEIVDNADDLAIASIIIAIAHQLKFSVIAEGVENIEQLQILESMGCDQIQGYYFSRPLPSDQLSAFVRNYYQINL